MFICLEFSLVLTNPSCATMFHQPTKQGCPQLLEARTVRGAQQLFGNLTGWVREAEQNAAGVEDDPLQFGVVS